MSNPLLSIVIPTKNRYYYLKILIDSLLSHDSQEFELIIQDNSDDNSDFIDIVKRYNIDRRFKYNYSQGWLSVIDNCDLAVSAASGQYVCMLGDDDGIILDRALFLAKWLKENNYDSCYVRPILYSWPDVKHAVWDDSFSGKIEPFEVFTNTIVELNIESQLTRVLDKGAGFGLGNLPRIYQSFVSSNVLLKLKEDTNTYFPGPSPDMSNAVGISKYLTNYVFVDIPIVISGHCMKSTAGQGNMKKHIGSIESQKHLPLNTAKEWGKRIPFFWSGPTIYAESARKALLATGRSNSHMINYPALYSCCLVYERNYSREVLATAMSESTFLQKQIMLFKVLLYSLKIFTRRAYYFLKNFIFMRLREDNRRSAEDIRKAIDIAVEYSSNEDFVLK